MRDITLEYWKKFSSSERETYAKSLAGDLPSGFTYHSLQTCGLGSENYEIARFEFQGAAFMLIPGGAARLGYDADRHWEPTQEELESWQNTAEEYELDLSIQERVLQATLRPRDLLVKTLLVEAGASELGWESVDVDDPEIRQIIDRAFPKDRSSLQVGFSRGDIHLRLRRDAAGRITAQRSAEQTHQELADTLAKAGFRFPTSDEWEYVCGGDSETLFRWGDHVPCDRYPTDLSPAEAEWREQWALSAGRLEYPPQGFLPDWDLHRHPNNFGVAIASDPYKYELVAEPELTRGGDGGGMVCGGAGFFAGWITLATAYFEDSCKRDPHSPILAGYTIGRRVLPLEW